MSTDPSRFEVEIKFHDADSAELRRRLLELGARDQGSVQEEDTYFAHPARDFAFSGEVFRIRRQGLRVLMTYKGPKQPGPTKSREELELHVTEASDQTGMLETMFLRLGFQAVGTVKKRRESFKLFFRGRAMTVTLDEVEGLGRFSEVETLAQGQDLQPAQADVVELAEQLGLRDVEPRSYLRLLLDHKRNSAGH